MPTQIKPFRTVNETDCINGLFAYQGAVPALAGTFVKVSSGFLPSQHSLVNGTPGNAYTNTQSPRWTNPATVVPVTASGDQAIGVLLYDVRETDENGEKLIFHPRKAAENNWVISGEGCNILTKGMVFVSGIEGTVTAGHNAYISGSSSLQGLAFSVGTVATKVGKFLGPKDAAGFALLKLEL